MFFRKRWELYITNQMSGRVNKMVMKMEMMMMMMATFITVSFKKIAVRKPQNGGTNYNS